MANDKSGTQAHRKPIQIWLTASEVPEKLHVPPHPSSTRNLLRQNPFAPVVMIGGTVLCLCVIAYAEWLSRQTLQYPEWAVKPPETKMTKFVRFNSDNIAVMQGLATITYSIGLAGIALGTKFITESAIWPLLSKQHLTVDEIGEYLQAARGSIPSTMLSWRLIRTKSAALFLLVSALNTLTPLAAAPVVGAVFARGYFETDFQSIYTVGNGVGRIFAQTNPPIAIADNSQASYVSWSLDQSPEPLKYQRLWIIDRSILLNRGSMNIQAVRADTTISCQGTRIKEIGVSNETASFATKMANHNWRAVKSSDHARVRLGKAVGVWVDDFRFDDETQTSADLIFVAFNGTLENGAQATLSNGWTTSSINCTVSVNLVDDFLTIGEISLSSPRALLSSNNNTGVPTIGRNYSSSSPPTLNENALWFAVAPMLVGVSVDGSQPLYYRWNATSDSSLPSSYTRAAYVKYPEAEYRWSTRNVEDFINVAVGSVAQAASRNNPTGWTIICSRASTRKLHRNRSCYLIVPMGIILMGEIVLWFWNGQLHRKGRLPIMRMATTSELIKSVLTECFFDQAKLNSQATEPSKLDGLKVRYGWVKGIQGRYVAGLADEVVPFVEDCELEKGTQRESLLKGKRHTL